MWGVIALEAEKSALARPIFQGWIYMPENVSDASEVERKRNAERSASKSRYEKRLDDVHKTYSENYKELLGYAYTLVGSTVAAQDVVQQAFTNTLTAIENGSQIHTMGGFIYRCVHNLSMSHIAREPETQLVEETPLLIEQSTASVAEARSHWHRVHETLDTLPASQRVAFLLAEVKGLRYDEIADAMGRSTNAVRQLLNRARGKIRARVNIDSDWAGLPIPVLAADSAIKSRRPSLGSNMAGWLRPKASELQAWLGNLSQTYADTLMRGSYSIIVGSVMVALATASPAPATKQDIPPASNSAVSAPLASRPHTDSTATRIDETALVPSAAARRPSDLADHSRAVPAENSSTDPNKSTDIANSDYEGTAINVAGEQDPKSGHAGNGGQPDNGKNDNDEEGECVDRGSEILGHDSCLSDDEQGPDPNPGEENPKNLEGGPDSTTDTDPSIDSCPDEGKPEDPEDKSEDPQGKPKDPEDKPGDPKEDPKDPPADIDGTDCPA